MKNEDKCVMCGFEGEMPSRMVEADYNNVATIVLPTFTCPQCSEEYEEVYQPNKLATTVAKAIAKQRERLTPNQVRFLRKYTGMSGSDFADFIGNNVRTVYRWESDKDTLQIPLAVERLLRLSVRSGNLVRENKIENKLSVRTPVIKEVGGRWEVAA